MWTTGANSPSFVPKAASGHKLIIGKDKHLSLPRVVEMKPASVPTDSRNRQTFVPAGSRNRPTSVLAGRTFFAGWKNNAARPMTRPTSHYFQHFRRPGYSNHLNMDEGRSITLFQTNHRCRLQKQAYEANATAEKHLSQADIATSRNGVPAGKVDPAADVTADPYLTRLLQENLLLRTKWKKFLKNKRDARGIDVKNKARMVAANVICKRYGIDYDESCESFVWSSTSTKACVRPAQHPLKLSKPKSKEEHDDAVKFTYTDP
ncbi:hypothetical protein Tco_1400928 [Tanacetum coccineum]